MREKRLHFVLVPGFGGFDALGQLEYYAGVTPVFRHWRDGLIAHDRYEHGNGQSSSGEKHIIDKSSTVLHYFDNFPTASVKTRAQRLRMHLAERLARGEFSAEDRVALVGHSTGGLDIRRLIWDLNEDHKERVGYRSDGYSVAAKDILDVIDHIVFLSVPQKGTNIASWTDWMWLLCKLSVADFRSMVDASQAAFLEQVEGLFLEGLAMSDVDLVLATRDAINEARLRIGATPMETALSQEAASQLSLWLRHIFWDFGAIKDLLPESTVPRASGDSGRLSPAHFSAGQRKEELEIWRAHGISFRSYATLSKSPFDDSVITKINPVSLLYPQTYLRLILEAMDSKVDLPFAVCHHLCANGAYKDDDIPAPKVLMDTDSVVPAIGVHHNDGIVNTASMLWPNAEDTLLVHCDHMDIVGHYRRVPEKRTGGRRYQAYDLLKSDSGFDETIFEKVWCDVFESCLVTAAAGPAPAESSGRKRSGSAVAT